MANEIDTKVLEMVFNNKDFEKGIQETQNSINGLNNTLSDLKTSLDKGVDTSLSNVQGALVAKAAAINSVVSSLCNELMSKVLSTTRSIEQKINALTIAPISAGSQKYDEQVQSVQTIMNATGKSIDTVTKQLEKLMWYTDETSYNYTDMASNIGKFTSAGVELEDAVTAMMGIANWAGVSGANVNEASRAMYNLSQAMGVGQLKLQDWKSIENANMATKEFKETLIETAIEVGTLEKDTEVTAETMSSTLSDGWATSEVLTKTLAKYGNYTEDLYKIIQDSNGKIDVAADAMKVYTEKYADCLDELYDAFEKYGKESDEFKKVVKKNNIAINTAIDLVSVTKAKKFNENLVATAETLNSVADKFGVESEEFAKAAKEAGYTIKDAATIVAEGIDNFKMSEKSLGEKSFKAAQEAKTFKDAWDATIDAVSTQWMRFWNAVFGNYEEAKVMWTDLANVMWDVFASLPSTLADIMEMVAELGGRGNVLEALSNIWSYINEIFDVVKEAFTEVFPLFEQFENVGALIYAITEKIKEANSELSLTTEQQYNLRAALDGVFSVAKSVANLIFNIGWNLGRIISAFLPNSDLILQWLAQMLTGAKKIDIITTKTMSIITYFTDIVVAVIKRIVELVSEGISFVIKVFTLGFGFLFKWLQDNGVFDTVLEYFSYFVGALVWAAVNAYSVFSYLFEGVANVVIAVMGVIDQFKEAPDKIEQLKEWLGPFHVIVDILVTVYQVAVSVGTIVVNSIRYFSDALAGFISNIDVWKATIIATISSLVLMGIGFTTVFTNLGNGIGGLFTRLIRSFNPLGAIVGEFLDGIRMTINRIFGFIDVARLEAVGHMLKAFGLTMLMIAGAAIVMSTIDPDMFYQVMVAVTVMMVGLGIFAAAMAHIKTPLAQLINSSSFVANFGSSLSALVSAFDMVGIFVGISALISAMSGLIKIVKDVYEATNGDWTSFAIIMGTVLGIIFALFLMMKNFISKLSPVSNGPNPIQDAEVTIANIGVEIKAFGGTFKDFAFSLLIATLALAILARIDFNAIKTALAVLGAITLGLLGVMLVMVLFVKILQGDQTVTRAAGGAAGQGADENIALSRAVRDAAVSLGFLSAALVAFSTAMFGLVAALVVLTFLPQDNLENAALILGGLALVMGLVITAFIGILMTLSGELRTDTIANTTTGLRRTYNQTGALGKDVMLASLAFVFIATAIDMLVLALIPLVYLYEKNSEGLWDAAMVIVAFAVLLGALVAILSLTMQNASVSGKEIAIAAVALLPVALAIIALIGTIVLFAKMIEDNSEAFIQVAVTVGGILTLFIVYVTLLCNGLSKAANAFHATTAGRRISAISDAFVSVAASLLILGVAVGIIIASMALLVHLGDTNEILASGATAVLLLGELIYFAVKVLTIITEYSKGVTGGGRGRNGNTNAERIKSIGIQMVLIASAMAIIAAGVSAMLLSLAALTNYGNFWTIAEGGVVAIALIGALFAALFGLLELKKRYGIKDTTTILLLAASMDLMAAAVAIIIFPMIELTKLFQNGLYKEVSVAFIGIIGILSMFVLYSIAMVGIITKLMPGANAMDVAVIALSLAGSMVLMATAVVIISNAVEKLSGIDASALASSMMGIAVLLIVMGVINSLLAKSVNSGSLGTGSLNILVAAASIVILASAMLILVPAIESLSKLEFGEFLKVIVEIAITLAVIAGIVYVLGIIADKIGAPLMQLAFVFLLIAAAVAIVSIGLSYLQDSIVNMANDPNIQNAGDRIAEVFTKLIENNPGLGTAIGTIIALNIVRGIIRTIINHGIISPIFTAIGTAIKGWLTGTVGPWIATTLVPFLTNPITIAVLAIIALVWAIWHHEDWEHAGEKLAQRVRSGAENINIFEKAFADLGDLITRLEGYGKTVEELHNEQMAQQEAVKKSYEDTYKTANGYYNDLMRQELVEKGVTDEGSINDYIAYEVNIAREELNKIRKERTDDEREWQLQIEREVEESQLRIDHIKQDNLSKAKQYSQEETDEIIANGRKVREEQRAARAEQKAANEAKLKELQDEYDANEANAASKENIDKAEADRAQKLADAKTNYAEEDKKATEEQGKTEQKVDSDQIVSTSNIVDARNIENEKIAEGNELLAERLGVEETLNNLSSKNGTLLADIGNRIKDYFTVAFKGKFGITSVDTQKYNAITDIIKMGADENLVGSAITSAIGKVVDKKKVKEFISSFLNVNWDAVNNFDTKDIAGSLKKVFNLENVSGRELLNNILGGLGINVNESGVLSLDGLISSLGLEDTVKKYKDMLTGANGENGIDLSGLSDELDTSAYSDMVSQATSSAVSDGVIDGLIDPSTTSAVTDAADSYATAYSNALEAARTKAEEIQKEEAESIQDIGDIYGESVTALFDPSKLDITKMSTEEVNKLNDKYYKHYNFLNKQLTNLTKQFKNKDGTWKDTTAESDKTYFESVEKDLETYKTGYETLQSAIKSENEAREERYRTRGFDAIYKDSAEKLDSDIEKQKTIIDGIKNILLNGSVSIDKEEDLYKQLEYATSYLKELVDYQQKQNEALDKEISENGEESTFANPYSQEAKAARASFAESMKDAKKRYNEAQWYLSRYYEIPETARSAYVKEQIEKYEKQRDEAKTDYENARTLYNNALPGSYTAMSEALEAYEQEKQDLLDSLNWNSSKMTYEEIAEAFEKIRQLDAAIEKTKAAIEKDQALFTGEEGEETASAEELATNSITSLGSSAAITSGSLASLDSSASDLSDTLTGLTNLDTSGLTDVAAASGQSTTDLNASFDSLTDSAKNAASNLPTKDNYEDWLNTDSDGYTTISTGSTKLYGIDDESPKVGRFVDASATTSENVTIISSYMNDVYGKVQSIDTKIASILTKLSDITSNQDTLNYVLATSTNTICNDGVNVNIVNYSKVSNKIAADVDKILGRKSAAALRGN